MRATLNKPAHQDSSNTFSIDKLLEILVNQYQYAIIEISDTSFILENNSIPEFGQHTIKFICNHSTGNVNYLIGQLHYEPLKTYKNIMVQEFIQRIMRS